MPVSARSLPLGSRLPWFSCRDLEGTLIEPPALPADAPVLVAFLCQHSPYVVHIEEHLARAARQYIVRGLAIIGISPNDVRAYPSDSSAMLREQALRADFSFPYCLDEQQHAAKAFGASCTPEFFLYDDSHRLVYHGQYDASRPGNGLPVTGHDLDVAVQSVMAEDIVVCDQLPSFGCSVKWTAGHEPSYVYG